MRPRSLAHRLLALVMGVLALQLTLRGASLVCATSSTGPGSGHAAEMMTAAAAPAGPAEHAGMAAMRHGGAHVAHAAAAATAGSTTEAEAMRAVAPAPDCPMPAAAGGCVASTCMTAPPAVGAQIVGVVAESDGGQAVWSLSLHGPTRSLIPAVPPPKA